MRPALQRRPRALLLDDDPAVLRLLGRELSARGAEVTVARDGADGLSALLDVLLGLDVLVIDLDLPGRDAWSFLSVIRRAGGEQDLRVVVLADRPAPELRERLLAHGADAVSDRADGPEAAALAALAAASSRRSPALARRERPSPRRPFFPALPSLAPWDPLPSH